MTFKLDIKTEKSKPEPVKQFIQLIHESEKEVLSVYRFALNNNMYHIEKYGEIGWCWTGNSATIEEGIQRIESGNCYTKIK